MTTWTTIASPDPHQQYVVLATRFVVTSRRHIPAIARTTQALWPALSASDGLIGYSTRIDIRRGTLSTLTAWRTRADLTRFVHGEAHTRVVARTRHRMAGNAFTSWTTPGADLPPTWSHADAHLTPAGPPPRSW